MERQFLLFFKFVNSRIKILIQIRGFDNGCRLHLDSSGGRPIAGIGLVYRNQNGAGGQSCKGKNLKEYVYRQMCTHRSSTVISCHLLICNNLCFLMIHSRKRCSFSFSVRVNLSFIFSVFLQIIYLAIIGGTYYFIANSSFEYIPGYYLSGVHRYMLKSLQLSL